MRVMRVTGRVGSTKKGSPDDSGPGAGAAAAANVCGRSNPASVNAANAGSTVPLKFVVEGVASVPIDSQEVDCTTLEPTGAAPVAIAAPAFPKKGSEYHVNWKTDGAWAETCRRVTVRIPAASDAWAYFDFH